MAYIRLVDEAEADGTLAHVYDAAIKRSGRIYNIFRVQSQSPKALQMCMGLYSATMKSDSPLSRAQREMMAVVVSKVNACHY